MQETHVKISVLRPGWIVAGSFLLCAPVIGLPADNATTSPLDVPRASSEGHVIYTPADFAQYSPKNALDMLKQVPGFSISSVEQGRGLGEASVNVLLNGERLELKSETITNRLQKVPADKVERIEIVDGASLRIPGLAGQVANIITSIGGVSGQYEWDSRFRPGYVSPAWLGGNVSVNGSTQRLDYTAAVSNDIGTGAIKGPTVISDAGGTVTESRQIHFRNHFNAPKVSGSLKWDGPGTSVAHLNAQYQQTYRNSKDTETRTVPGGVDRLYTNTPRDRGRNYEIGGNFEFALGPGRLRLVGLDRYEHDRFRQDVVFEYLDGSPDTGGRFASASSNHEYVARSEYNWRLLGGDWQLSAEGAFNRYEGRAKLFDLDATGRLVETPFPAGTGGVNEDRYESILTHGRQLATNLTLQLGVGGEYSRLSQTGSQGLVRTFRRPKGSVSLAWTPSKDLNVGLKIARSVGQLSFGDFLAREDLDQQNGSAGNVNLVPPQLWELNFEAKKELGAWGTTTLKLYGKWSQDYIDYIPVPGGGEARGNISRARVRGIEWISTFKFDQLGWPGAKIDADLSADTSAVRDPLTGTRRGFSNENNRVANVTLRDDLPRSSLAWGAGVQYSHVLPYYRLSEVGIDYEGPAYTFAFIEHKDVFGLDVRLQVFNLTDGRHIARRTVYDGFRNASPVLFREDGNQSVGFIYQLFVKGKF
jgi:hypothetical protein